MLMPLNRERAYLQVLASLAILLLGVAAGTGLPMSTFMLSNSLPTGSSCSMLGI